MKIPPLPGNPYPEVIKGDIPVGDAMIVYSNLAVAYELRTLNLLLLAQPHDITDAPESVQRFIAARSREAALRLSLGPEEVQP